MRTAERKSVQATDFSPPDSDRNVMSTVATIVACVVLSGVMRVRI